MCKGNFGQPLVSVIVPVYNVEHFLAACVESIVGQTYKNIEIILVDDGSKDSSGTLCDEFAGKDGRIKVIHKENGGLSDARNKGVSQATGEYIVFVDSDDLIDNRMIETLLQLSLETEVDIVISDLLHVFKPQDLQYVVSNVKKIYSSEEAVCEMWYQTSFLPSAGGKLYRANIIKNTPFRVGILFEDIDMMHEIFWKAEKILYNPSKFYAYQHRDESITTKPFSHRDCEILNICDRLKMFAEDKSIEVKKAAMAYGVVGALRVELNAPNNVEFESERQRARKCIDTDWRVVVKNKCVRKKTRIGLIMYKYCKPLMKVVYARINRWK